MMARHGLQESTGQGLLLFGTVVTANWGGMDLELAVHRLCQWLL